MVSNEHMKALLDEFTDTKDLEVLLLHCAIWTADEIDNFNFKPLPMEPQQVRDYEDIPEFQQKNLDAEYFKQNPQVLEFYALERKIKSENKAIYDWLLECRARLIVAGEVERTELLDSKLKDITVEQLK